jgi:hypothetical protein
MKKYLTHHCVTHKVQNVHYKQLTIDDSILYMNWQIVMGRYSSDMIINMDETNPSPKTTLCRIRERSVNAHISGHSGCCTVVFACTMS